MTSKYDGHSLTELTERCTSCGCTYVETGDLARYCGCEPDCDRIESLLAQRDELAEALRDLAYASLPFAIPGKSFEHSLLDASRNKAIDALAKLDEAKP